MKRTRHLLTTTTLLLVALLEPGAPGHSAPTNTPGGTPPLRATSSSTRTPPPVPLATNAPPPAPPLLEAHDLPEIHGKISLPRDWTLLPGKLLEGDVLLATREKITGENDSWTTGLSMRIDRNGAKDSGQKAGDYAMGLALEAREKAGEEASSITDSPSGPYRRIRFEFPVPSEPPLQITEILLANEKTGTLAVILWQSPSAEAPALHDLREAILSSITLDPAQ